MSLQQPKLTPSQLEQATKLTEACLVHPFVTSDLSERSKPERDQILKDYSKCYEAFVDFFRPAVALSLIQSVVDPNRKDSTDLDHNLTE